MIYRRNWRTLGERGRGENFESQHIVIDSILGIAKKGTVLAGRGKWVVLPRGRGERVQLVTVTVEGGHEHNEIPR